MGVSCSHHQKRYLCLDKSAHPFPKTRREFPYIDRVHQENFLRGGVGRTPVRSRVGPSTFYVSDAFWSIPDVAASRLISFPRSSLLPTFSYCLNQKQNETNVSSPASYIKIWRIWKSSCHPSLKIKKNLLSVLPSQTLWSNQYPALIFTTLESDSAFSSTLKCYKSSAGADEIMITDGNQACRIRRHNT